MWMDLPVWPRLCCALGLFALGGVVAWYVSARWGFALFGLGFVALIFATKTDSEKKGYRF
jgi:hypothetical protein